MPLLGFARFYLLLSVLSLSAGSGVWAEETQPSLVARQPVTLTFFVSEIECSSCVEVVKQSVQHMKGVSGVKMEQRLDSVANVTFDPALVRPHDVALAVRDTVRLHGLPYEARLRLRIPACIQPENRALIESKLAQLSPHLQFRLVDPDVGEYSADLKLPAEDQPAIKTWWDFDQLEKALRMPQPHGLGLKFEWVKEEI